MIAVFQLLQTVVDTKKPELHSAMVSSRLLDILREVFLSTPTNSIIHNCYLKMVQSMIAQESGPLYDKVTLYLTKIFSTDYILHILKHHRDVLSKHNLLVIAPASTVDSPSGLSPVPQPSVANQREKQLANKPLWNYLYLTHISKLALTLQKFSALLTLEKFFNSEVWKEYSKDVLPELKRQESLLQAGKEGSNNTKGKWMFTDSDDDEGEQVTLPGGFNLISQHQLTSLLSQHHEAKNASNQQTNMEDMDHESDEIEIEENWNQSNEFASSEVLIEDQPNNNGSPNRDPQFTTEPSPESN